MNAATVFNATEKPALRPVHTRLEGGDYMAIRFPTAEY